MASSSTQPPADARLEPVRIGTSRKSVWLTDEARAAIQAWADLNQTSFSAAIETLARLGLGERVDKAIAPMLTSVIRRTLRSQMEHLSQLAARTAISSDMVTSVARAVLRLAIQDRAQARPEDFHDSILNVYDDDPIEDLYQEICRNARRDAARRLKTPLDLLLAPDAAASPALTKQA